MEKYVVSLFFGTYTPNPFVTATKIEVEVPEGASRNEIILKAITKYGKAYPRTYSANINKIIVNS